MMHRVLHSRRHQPQILSSTRKRRLSVSIVPSSDSVYQRRFYGSTFVNFLPYPSSSSGGTSFLPPPTILYSDNHILAVNKPAGWHSIPNILYERPAASQRPDGYTQDERDVFAMTIRPEVVRFITYCLFWGMCALAFIVRAIWVIPMIEAGFDGNHPEQKGCGPFNRGIDRANKVFDLDFGDAFTIEESHLVESFGHNNICVAWDYTPSRE